MIEDSLSVWITSKLSKCCVIYTSNGKIRNIDDQSYPIYALDMFVETLI